MTPTWTKIIPEHYGTDVKSPSPSPDEIYKQPFPLMRLPVEIRLQVYRDYLIDRYSLSPAEIHEMVLNSHHRTKSSAEILQVSKTVNAEIRDLLQQETTITLRICWQDATLDGLAMSSLQSRGERLDYGHITHLRVEIYPPHLERPTDITCIWRHVQKLCSDLQKVSCLQHLSLHFMENEYAAWSGHWRPFSTSYDADQEPWDLLYILDLCKTLKNVKKAQIYLPDSVIENVSLQKERQNTEEVMMQITSLDDRYQKWVIGTIEKALGEEEEVYKYCTGSNAQEKLDRICPEGCFMLEHHFEIFEKVWPHRDCVFPWEYRSACEYIGAEEQEGKRLNWGDNPSDGEYYSDEEVHEPLWR